MCVCMDSPYSQNFLVHFYRDTVVTFSFWEHSSYYFFYEAVVAVPVAEEEAVCTSAANPER